MESDRNLLFGVLALLTDVVSRDQFIEACTTWSARKEVSLADLMVERGWISTTDRADVEMILERKLKKHACDTHAGLAEIANESVCESLAGLVDRELQESITALAKKATLPDSRTSDYQPVGRSRYTLARLHAKGGIGQVWVARDGDPGREVALKELLDGSAENPALAARFVDEAKITGPLEHPNIVPVYELAAPQNPADRPFYTMRFVRGRTLSAAIRNYHRKRAAGEPVPVELRELLNHFVAVCNALAYAHSRGVLHRDLKPGNIVLGDYGEAIVLDWRLAKIKGTSESPNSLLPVNVSDQSTGHGTIQGQIIGTPAYMPPEQAEGRLDRIDERSDIYNLGAILYEILFGEAPFDGPDSASILQQVLSETPVSPRRRLPQTPAALEAVCLKALAKQPAARYTSAKELAADVQRWMPDEPVSAWSEPLRLRAGRWARRHRPAVAGAAALLLTATIALCAGTVLLCRANARTKQERDHAEANFVAAQLAGEKARLAAERAERAREAEAGARRQTRRALDEMSSQVIADWLSQKDLKPDAAQEKFPTNALAYYRSFAEEAGDSEEVRWSAADAHLRIGEIYLNLSHLPEVEAAERKAIDALAAPGREFPDQSRYPARRAAAYGKLASIFRDKGNFRDSEAALLESPGLLQKLIQVHSEQAEFHLESGDTYSALAGVYASTRRTREADEAYSKSLAELQALVRQFPSEPKYRSSLAALQSSRAGRLSDRGLVTEAESAEREAIDLRRALAAEAAEQPGHRHDLAKSFLSLGQILKSSGRNREAEENYRQALALCKQLAAAYPSIAEFRRSLADANQQLGILFAGTGRTDDAEPLFRDSLAVRQQLAADFPTSVKFRVELTYALNNLGVFLYTTSRPKEAETLYREAIATIRKLADASPGVTEYRERLGGRLYNLAILLQEMSQTGQAAAAFREAIAVFQKLSVELPDVPAHRRTLAKCLTALSGLQQHDGQLSAAESQTGEAIAVLRRLLAEDPKAPDYREDLALGLDNYSILLRRLKRRSEAAEKVREAIAIYEHLAQDVPEEPHYDEELARALIHSAMLECDDKDFAKALTHLDRAKPLLDKALQANPKYGVYHRDVRELRYTMAVCLAGSHECERALATAEGIGKLGWDPAEENYLSGCALARCAVIVEEAGASSAQKQSLESAKFADRAVAALRLGPCKTDSAMRKK